VGQSFAFLGIQFRVRNDGQVQSNAGFTTLGADFAELIEADESVSPETESYQPGDVLVISPETGKLRKSNKPYSTLVAGIYSTKAAFLGNQGIADETSARMLPVALVGVVPTKVNAENGAIHPGDLLTTSSTPGYAMRASPVVVRGVKVYRTGTIVGKALEPLKNGKGVIKVLVTLR